MKRISIRVNHGLAEYRPGEVVEVDAHDDGTPVLNFWRRCLRDAVIDRCCEVVVSDNANRALMTESDGGEG